MELKVNLTNVITAIITAISIWVGTTVYSLDKQIVLMDYQLQQVHRTLQMLSEEKKDKADGNL